MKNIYLIIFLVVAQTSCREAQHHDKHDSNPLTEEELYRLRFSNLSKLKSVNHFIEQDTIVELFILQGDKCNLCIGNNLKLLNDTLKSYSNPVIIVLGRDQENRDGVSMYFTNKHRLLEFNSLEMSKLGLSLLDNYLVTFKYGKLDTWRQVK
jgi:hypothetical protein